MPTSTEARIVVEIEDITAPATFSRLSDALAALWASLRELPLGWQQHEAYRYFLGEGAEQRVEDHLARGEMVLSFAMAGRSHLVRVRREKPVA
ncbi:MULTISPECIES: hypothetical protein [Kitasatospora]|uniref:Uncharacterized protein n=1 Tax=Kitasatospora cystarginea TaxID=58350 RepID=A0ABN3EWP8_9ACTN